MKGKQPTDYRGLIWGSLMNINMNSFSPKKTLSENHEQSSVENESVNKMNVSQELLNRWRRETSQTDTCNSSQILFHLFKV
jgi:hypothetical protein